MVLLWDYDGDAITGGDGDGDGDGDAIADGGGDGDGDDWSTRIVVSTIFTETLRCIASHLPRTSLATKE